MRTRFAFGARVPGIAGSPITSPATVSRPVCEPASAAFAADRIARVGAFGAIWFRRRVRLRERNRLLFLRHDAGRLRRWLCLKRNAPADHRKGPQPARSMVRDGRCIRLRSDADRRASCGRLHDPSSERYSGADGRDNDGKKGQPLDSTQWLSLQRHRLGARPTGFRSECS